MDNNMMTDGIISLDDRPAIAAINRANSGLDGHEKKTKTVLDRSGREWQVYGEGLVRVTDKSKNSLDRLLSSMQKQADMAGKTGVERMIAQRDQLIAKWGQEERAVQAITKSYDKMIAAQSGNGGDSRWKQFAEGVKNGIQNPLQAAGDAIRGVLEKLGPMGSAAAAAIGFLSGIAVAAWEAAKGFGELGLQTENVKLRTGLATKEVGQFSFAAKMAGQDVSIYERMMKGLSEAADEQSSKGDKARATLRNMGVDLRGMTGEMKPTSQLLLEISAGLGKLPEGVQRDAAAMDLFKKVGIEAIPVITALNENVKRAKELGLGATEEDLRRWEQYHHRVAEAEVWWNRFTRKLKEPLAAVVTIAFKDNGGHEYSIDDLQKRGVNLGQWAPRTQRQNEEAARAAGFGSLVDRNRGFSDALAMDSAASYTSKIEERKRADAAVLSYQASEGLAGQLKVAEAAFGKMSKPEVGVSSVQDVSDYGAAEKRVQVLKDRIDAGKHVIEQLKEFRRAAGEFEKKGDEAELSVTDKIYYQRDLLLKQAEKLKGVEGDIAKIRKAADEQASAVFKKDWAEFEKDDQKRSADQQRRAIGLLGPSKEQMKEWGEGFAAQDQIDSINLQSRRDTLSRNASHAGRMVELGGATGMDAIRATYQIRIELANQLAAVEAERILKQTNGAQQLVEGARALKELNKQVAEAQEESLMKQLELQKQQMDTLKRESEGLWNTLLTKPGNFGRQLGDTIHAAVLKPITEGLAGMTANVLKPIIYGSDGQGGLAGIFKGVFGGGKSDPMKMATDMNTAVTAQNSMALATLTAIMAGAMGMAAPAMAAPAGMGGLSVPSISAPSIVGGGGGVLPAVFGGGGGGGNPLAGIFGGSGGPGATTPPFMQSGSPGATGSAGGWGGMLKNLKGIQWGGLTHAPSRWSMDENGEMTKLSDGKITGVNGAAGAGLQAGGMFLAQRGLMGADRGTWKGVGEGAAGGAMVGFQMGGPLGAVIGGIAGFGVGIGEKIAGVETPEAEAKRLIKQIYSLTIDNNTAKQIAAMAKQSFGGQVSVAVRSPEVRQLLQLVAESTGQKSNLYLNDPHGVYLTQAGGRMNQSAFYNNGTPSTYTSNLPVLGPAGATVPSGNPYGGGGNIILNVNGQSAADLLEGRAGSYIASNPRMISGSAANGWGAGSSRHGAASALLAPDIAVL